MDPMLQLAKRFLATEYKFDRKSRDEILKKIEADIKQQSMPKNGAGQDWLQLTLWKARDVRAQDILANVLYRNPKIARQLCELRPELCPEFVSYLVDQARREWQEEKARLGWPPKQEICKLFEEKGYKVHETFPDALELALVEKPEFMQALANHLKVALPFSLVLREELAEIQRSRESRLLEDLDARATQSTKDIYRIHTILGRLSANDHRRGQYQARLRRLEKCIEEKNGFKTANGAKPAGRRQSPKNAPVTNDLPKNNGSSGQQPDHETAAGYAPAQAEKMSLFGVALSGGGIRSATFNLGLLQGMANLDLLRRVDYLSGVSGGSHIAGWLAAWIKREHDGIRKVQRWLSPLRCPDPGSFETQPIHFLRRFSNYLAPRKAVLSADVWSMPSAWLRNTLLNQIVFVQLLASLLGLPKLLFHVFDHSAWFASNEGWIGGLSILLMGGLALLIGLNLNRFDHDPRPGRGDRRRPSRLWEEFGIQATVVFGFMILGLLGSYQLWWLQGAPPPQRHWGLMYAVLFLALLLAQVCARNWRCFYSQRSEDTTNVQTALALLATAASSALSSFIGWGVLYIGLQQFERFQQRSPSLRAALGQADTIVFGPVAIVGTLSLVIIFQMGLLGHNFPDSRREWWSRLGAKLFIACLLWIALAGCSLFGPWLVLELIGLHHLAVPGSVLIWLVTTTIGFSMGRSAKTPPFPVEKEAMTTKRLEWLARVASGEWIVRIAPYFYIGGLAIFVSFLLYSLVTLLQWNPLPEASAYWEPWSLDLLLFGSWWLPAAMLLLAMLLAWRFDVNEFSMHHFYRNRLVRCYLGASRAHGTRRPNPFTGFDPEDDLSLSDFRVAPPAPHNLARAARPYYGPFPIINTALNLVAGKELAWQERKAASFAFTPLYCGYEYAAGEARPRSNFANSGYRPTTDYAEPRSGGVSLGTAFAISGAAVNPSMGYHSSLAVSFLMALFNVRLGCWLGNTRHRKSWKKSSPGLGLTYLINELIGNTDDTSWFVNLSDGGHFENLGLYELVRRRCKYIIASDAEQDSTFSFNALGNAIRKCRTDFGVDIRLNPDQLRPVPGMGKSRTHCAVGEIVYSADVRGTLVYIKTSLTGDEPGDVLEYKLSHSVFPHQSTFNQFFDESQFESYRGLGLHTATVILMRAAQFSPEIPNQAQSERGQPAMKTGIRSPIAENDSFLHEMFRYLQAMWYPCSQNMLALGEQHSRLYAELVEKFRSTGGSNLEAPARTFFRNSWLSTWRPNPEFLVYTTMIELMHRIFQDLELETTTDHPHNEGWVSMFRDWAHDPNFCRVWEDVRDNYDIRFRNFCNKEFDLDLDGSYELAVRVNS